MKITIFGREPAIWVYAINSLVALAVAFGLNLSQEQTGAITTIATGVLAAVVAIMTRPFVVSALTGAVGTILTAVAAFGLEFTSDQIGTFVAALGVVLSLALRMNVTPAADPAPGRV